MSPHVTVKVPQPFVTHDNVHLPQLCKYYQTTSCKLILTRFNEIISAQSFTIESQPLNNWIRTWRCCWRWVGGRILPATSTAAWCRQQVHAAISPSKQLNSSSRSDSTDCTLIGNSLSAGKPIVPKVPRAIRPITFYSLRWVDIST